MFFVIQWTNRNQAFYIFEHVLHVFRTWWISWSLHLENFTLRNKQTAHRSSCSHMSYKICVLKNFTNFTEKHLSWSHLLIKFQSWRPANLLKRDSNTGVCLWNFWEHLVLQNTSGDCFLIQLLLHRKMHSFEASRGIERCFQAD